MSSNFPLKIAASKRNEKATSPEYELRKLWTFCINATRSESTTLPEFFGSLNIYGILNLTRAVNSANRFKGAIVICGS